MSKLNNEMEYYVQWFFSPMTVKFDAIYLFWTDLNLTDIFPPFSLIEKFLQKLDDDNVRKAIPIV